jgi:hypothetical protein
MTRTVDGGDVAITPKIRLVCATRLSVEQFRTQSALGRSLALYRPYTFWELLLFPENSTGLPVLYNRALREAAQNPAVLIFLHDDVHIADFFWPMNILGGLTSFDVIGVAGNRRRLPRQPSWAFADPSFAWDDPQYLTGIVGHGLGFPPPKLTFYGTPGQEVKLLDGVLLAARSETLLAHAVTFDERFAFHFYDMDFCREVERKNLRMGTCAVSVVHESEGRLATPAWRASYEAYLQKWQT